MITSALVWGCAVSAPADLSASVDPSVPDAGEPRDPSSEAPSMKVPEKGEGTGGTERAETNKNSSDSGGSSGKPADAGGPEASVPSDPNASKLKQGDVLISEVMFDPTASEPASEWIEVFNATSAVRTLSGLTIVDGGNRTHQIKPGITIAPGAYVILARSKSAAIAAKVPAAAIVYEYGTGLADSAGIQLANGASGSVWLRDGGSVIARAEYGGWPGSSTGSSVQLKTLTYSASAQSSSWCVSTHVWTTGSDKGTPGAASDCP